MTITVRYFKEDTAHPEIPAVGNYITLTGKADRIDPVFRTLQVGETVVPLKIWLRSVGKASWRLTNISALQRIKHKKGHPVEKTAGGLAYL